MLSSNPLINLNMSQNRPKSSKCCEQQLSISVYWVAVEYCSIKVNIMLNLLHNLSPKVCKLPVVIVSNNRGCTEQHLSPTASEVWKHFKCANFLRLLVPPRPLVREDLTSAIGSSSAIPVATCCLTCPGQELCCQGNTEAAGDVESKGGDHDPPMVTLMRGSLLCMSWQ